MHKHQTAASAPNNPIARSVTCWAVRHSLCPCTLRRWLTRLHALQVPYALAQAMNINLLPKQEHQHRVSKGEVAKSRTIPHLRHSVTVTVTRWNNKSSFVLSLCVIGCAPQRHATLALCTCCRRTAARSAISCRRSTPRHISVLYAYLTREARYQDKETIQTGVWAHEELAACCNGVAASCAHEGQQ
jgi:hypothetical protein